MEADLMLRRKWTFRAQGKQIVLVKKHYEKSTHVLMKGFIWALYLPHYPNVAVEISIGDRYKPDVVALDASGSPMFWGEAGYITVQKMRSLLRRYPTTHFTMAKWNSQLKPFIENVKRAADGLTRESPIDVINFREDSVERFVDEKCNITIAHDYLDWVRIH